MSHPDNGSTTTLDMFISLPGKGNPPETMRSGAPPRGSMRYRCFQHRQPRHKRRGLRPSQRARAGSRERSAPVGVATNARPRRSGQEQAPSNDTRRDDSVREATAQGEGSHGRFWRRSWPADSQAWVAGRGKMLGHIHPGRPRSSDPPCTPKTRPINAAVWARTRQRTGWTEVLAGADTWH